MTHELERQPILGGDQLLLRPLVAEDWAALFAVAADKRVWEQHPMHDRWQEPVFRMFFDDALAKGGALAIVSKAGGEIIGSSRYQDYAPEDGGSVEIGWTFVAPEYWGTGINYELKQLMLSHAFQSVERVHFRVGETNIRSRKAMEKIGGILTDETQVAQLPDGPAVHVIYAITRASFAVGPLSKQ